MPGIVGHDSRAPWAQNKVGMRPDADEGDKRSNEIGTVIPLLDTPPDIAGRTITADALLTHSTMRIEVLIEPTVQSHCLLPHP